MHKDYDVTFKWMIQKYLEVRDYRQMEKATMMHTVKDQNWKYQYELTFRLI